MKLSIDLAGSTHVLLFLSTTSFFYSVYGAKKLWLILLDTKKSFKIQLVSLVALSLRIFQMGSLICSSIFLMKFIKVCSVSHFSLKKKDRSEASVVIHND